MNRIAPYAKALVAAVVAGLGSLYQALDGDQSITVQEWIAVAMTTLTALGVVFAIPNKDPEAEHQDESVQPPSRQRILGKAFTGGTFSKAEEDARNERGESWVGLALLVVVVILLLAAFGVIR
jgi:hypothetical protein